MNDPMAKTTAEWSGIEEAAGFLNFRIGAWHDFGYVTPPAPHCKPIPPLGERSAQAIKAGHGAIELIDEIARDLYRLREQLVGELRADEEIRAARVDAMLGDGRARQEAAAAPAGAWADTFKCCGTSMPWPTKAEDLVCPDCGTMWEREPIDIGAGARIKEDGRSGTKFGDYLDEHPLDEPEPTAAERPHQLSSRGALKDELGRLRRSREAWEETARACGCQLGLCSGRDFRDHAGETDPSGCMVCADLDPEQPCYAAVRGLRAPKEAGR